MVHHNLDLSDMQHIDDRPPKLYKILQMQEYETKLL